MRGWGSVAAVLAMVLLGIVVAVGPAEAHEIGPLQHLATDQLSPRLQELRFRTPALPEETRVRVLLPTGYDPSGATRYPVLYLVHGAVGTRASWTTAGDAEAITAGHPVIVVMPDGGAFGFYTDWWNFGAGGPAWETYHLDQLLPWIDAHYPTVGTRDGRAIAGESMGGLGAMHYAAARPDLFTAAGSFSGAVDTNLFVAPPIVEVASLAHSEPPAAVFGPRLTEEIRWRGHNPVDLAENLRGLLLQIDTGDGRPRLGSDVGSPVETAMYQMGLAFHTRLSDLGIGHIWDYYGPGNHGWLDWQRNLRELLPRLMERFAHPPAAPSRFTYTSTEPSYGVWGWEVALDRPAMEFSRISDAGPAGFALQGSGAATVTTAPLFEPRQVVTVHVTDATGTSRHDLRVDDAGRLTVPVSLGPGNPYQQHSPLGTVWALGTGAPLGTWPSSTASVSFAVGADAPTSSSTVGAGAITGPRTLPATGQEQAVPLVAGAIALVAALGARRAASSSAA